MVSRSRGWSDERFIGDTLVSGVAFTRDLLGDAPDSDTNTVERIIGNFEIGYVVSSTPSDSLSIVEVGIGVSSVEAFNLALAVGLPRPDVQVQYPPRGWLYVQSKSVRQVVSTSGDGLVDVWATFSFDLRGKRKVDKGVLFLIIVQTDISVGGAMLVIGRVRTLCLT